MTSAQINTIVNNYRQYLVLSQVPPATVDRKISSISKYLNFLATTDNLDCLGKKLPTATALQAEDNQQTIGHLEQLGVKVTRKVSLSNILNQLLFVRISRRLLVGINQLTKQLPHLPEIISYKIKYNRPKWLIRYQKLSFSRYLNLSLLIIIAVCLGIGGYDHINKLRLNRQGQILGSVPSRPPTKLSFQGRLTDSFGNPITTSSHFRFMLYSDPSASGSANVYEEAKWLQPDQDGIFNSYIGDTTPIAPEIFKDNPNLYLGITVNTNAEMAPRQQVATVGYAFNSEYLQGYPASPSAGINTIPVINEYGEMIIAAAAPAIRSTSGVFKLDAQTLYLTTSDNGNINLVPNGTGTINLTSQTAASNVVSATSSGTLTTGALYYGGVTSTAGTDYYLLKLQSATDTSPVDRFTVDALGNTQIAGYATVSGSLAVGYSSTLNGVGNAAFSGNVGIGTTAPDYKLDVSGGSGIIGRFSGRVIGGNAVNSDEFITLSQLTGGTGQYWSRTSPNLYPTTISDNVGIGNTSPGAYKLNVTGNTYLGGNLTSSGLLSFSGAGNNYFAGNVGIGTSGPANPLSIYDTTGSGGTLMQLTTTASGVTGGYLQLTADTRTVRFGADSMIGPHFGSTTKAGLMFLDNNSISPLLALDPNSGSVDLGTSSYRFGTLYATNANLAANLGVGYDPDDLVDGVAAFNGNVGIGISAPGYTLDVESATGEVFIKSTTGTNYANLRINNTGGDIWLGRDSSTGGGLLTGGAAYATVLSARGTYPLHLAVNNSPALTILNGGNVGIGTTGPNELLEVAAATGGRFILSDATGAERRVLLQVAPTSGADYARIEAYKYGTGAGGKNLAINPVGGGMVNIGGATFTYPLEVRKTTVGTQTMLMLSNQDTTTNSSSALAFNVTNSTTEMGKIALIRMDAPAVAGSDMAFSVYNSGLGEKMRITSAGNVGIGTTSPGVISSGFTAAGLVTHLKSTTTIARFVAEGTLPGILFSDYDGAVDRKNLQFLVDGGIGYFRSDTDAGAALKTNILVMDLGSGNVGIGTTGPTSLLAVGASSQFTVNSTGDITTSSTGELVIGGTGNSSIAGNLGIGTTAPSYKLDINGSLGVGGTATFTNKVKIADGTQAAGDVFTSDANGIGSWTAFSSIGIGGSGTQYYLPRFSGSTTLENSQLYDNATFVGIGGTAPATNPRLYINANSGNIGIGTTGPGAKLEIYGGGLKIQRSSAEPYSLFTYDTTAVAQIRGLIGGGLRFTDGTSNTEWARFDSNGNVGIGTTGPSHLLSISGSAAGTSVLSINNSMDSADNRNWAIGINQLNYGDFHIKTSDAKWGNPTTAGTTRLIIDKSGNIGIGTTGPQRLLSLYGGVLQITNSSTGQTANDGLQLFQSGSNAVIQQQENALLQLQTNSADRLTITGDGNVGIGTTGPGVISSGFTLSGLVSHLKSTTGIARGVFEGTVPGLYFSDYDGAADRKNFGFTVDGGIAKFRSDTDLGGTLKDNILVMDLGTGNVGIGTTAPANKLDVAGTVQMTGFKMTTSPSSGFALVSDAAGVGTWSDITGGNIGPWTLNGADLYPDNITYNVGIGNTSPGAYKLNVTGNTYLGGNLTSSGLLSFSGTGNNYFAGNVGIGTTNPYRKLEILDSATAQLRLTQSQYVNYSDILVDSTGLLELVSSKGKIALGSANTGAITSNPSSREDRAKAITVDANYIYTAGYDYSPGTTNSQWRIEKRDIATSALVTAFDTDGVVESNPSSRDDRANSIAVDANYIYTAGYDYSPGTTNSQWRIEKRDITTGALVTAFDTDGVVQNNPSSSYDQINSITVDANYIYVAGADYFPGNFQWRIEKRDITTGALVTAFDTDGVVQNNPSSGTDQINSITVDANYIYTAGYDYSPGTTYQWRIEKRDITTGALVTAFDTDGVVESNPGLLDHDYAYSITVDANYIYTAGSDGSLGNNQWRIEKRDITTGALVTAFDTDGVVQNNPSSGTDQINSITVDANYIYTAGYDYSPGTTYQWRIEKRDITTGALVTAFDTDGVVESNPGSGANYAYSIAVDANYTYTAGSDGSLNDKWRIEKRDITTGMLFHHDVNIYGDLIIGTEAASETIYDSDFTLDGNDLYLSGDIGVEGTIYTDKGINISSSSTPTLVGTLTDTTNLDDILEVKVRGHYVYYVSIGTTDSFGIIDISNKSAPFLVSSFTHSDLNNPAHLHIDGKYAYITSHGSDTLSIIDISNPKYPYLIKSITNSTILDCVRSVYMNGHYLYTATSCDGDSFSIIDISDPYNPTLIGYVRDARLDSVKISLVEERYAYAVSVYSQTISIIDISNPSNPFIVGSVLHSSLSDAQKVSKRGSYLFAVGSQGGITVINVSDPANPTYVNNIASNCDWDVRVMGERLYCSTYNAQYFTTYNISNPTTPTLISYYTDGSLLEHFDVSGNYAYVVSRGNDSLLVLYLGGLSSPTASIGSLNVDFANITGTLDVGGFSTFQSLSVGQPGLMSNGPIAVETERVFGDSALKLTTRDTIASGDIFQINAMPDKSDYVYYYNGSTYTDNTTEANSKNGTPFTLLEDSTAFSYFGNSTTFSSLNFDLETTGKSITEVLNYPGSSGFYNITADTTEANRPGGTAFTLLADAGDYEYFGLDTTFSELFVDVATAGTGMTTAWEYCTVKDGSNYCTTWSALTVSADETGPDNDGTDSFESDGKISWSVPGNWVTNRTNFGTYDTHALTKYWVRVHATALTVAPTAYYASAQLPVMVQYYNGSLWTDIPSIYDDSYGLARDGRISFAIPNNWATNSVDSQTAYWARLKLAFDNDSSTMTPGISPTANTATISLATGNLANFINAGTSMFSVNSNGNGYFSGNLGIGTTSPAYKLDISGGSGIVGQFSGRVIGANAVNSNEFATLAQVTSGVGPWSRTSPSVYLTTITDNVGIGTTAPVSSLHTTGVFSIGTGTDALTTLQYGAVSNGGFQIHNTQGTTEQRLSILDADATYGSALIYETRTSALTANSINADAVKFIIKDNGNVGIGTTGPSQLLQVAGIAQANTAFYVGTSTGTSGGDDNLIKPTSSSAWLNLKGGSGKSKITLGNESMYLSSGNTSGFIAFMNNGTSSTNLGTEAMRIIEGNVGIGTAAPDAKLELNSGTSADTLLHVGTGAAEYDSRLALTETDNYGLYLEYDGGANIGYIGMADNVVPDGAWSKRIQMSRTGSEVAFMAGNVGIGTTGPVYNLHINQSDSAAAITTYTNSSTGISSSDGFQVGISAVEDALLLNRESTNMLFYTANTEQMRIASNGNVGIGTTAPTSLLHLSSTSTSTAFSGFNLDWSPTAATTLTGDLFSLNIGVSANMSNLINIKDNGSSLFSVSKTTTTSNLPASFTSAGDVAIAYDLNFTNPTVSYIKSSAPLYLQTGETFNSSDLTLKTFNYGDVVLDSPGGVTLAQAQPWTLATSTNAINIHSGLLNLDTTNTRVGIGTTAPSALLHLAIGSTAAVGQKITLASGATANAFEVNSSAGTGGDKFVIKGSGNVGIGTTNPGTHALSVVGTAGLSTGTAWTNTSDARFKDIQSEVSGTGLEKIMALRPVSYTWNELHESRYGINPGLKYGFIAQEVMQIIPEFISQDAEGYYYYNPSGIEAILTSAVQELSLVNDFQSIEIDTLNSQNQEVFLNNNGNIQIVSVVNLDGTETYQVKDNTGTIFAKTATLGSAIIGDLQTGLIKTKELVAEKIIRTPKIETNLISSNNKDLVIDLGTNQGETLGPQDPTLPETQSGFGKLLVNGNVEISGDLTAQNVNADDAQFTGNVGIGQSLTANDASISGELYADSARFRKLQAETIEGIDGIFDKLSTDWLKSQNISGLEDQVTENTQSIPLVTPANSTGTPQGETLGIQGLTLTDTTSGVTADTATDSASLYDLALAWPVVNSTNDVVLTDSIKIEQNLSVNGITTLAQTIIAGPFSQDGTLIIDNGNSINVIADTLYLQNIGGGGIDLLAGKVTIDTNGNATFEGDLTVRGTLFAGLISNGGKDITIGLGTPQETTQGVPLGTQGDALVSPVAGTDRPALNVLGDNNQTVFSLDASGSAQFAGNIASSGFKIVRDAIASEPDLNGMFVSTASAGLAYISAGKKEVTIQSDFVTEKSLIYLTPIGSTENKVVYLARTKPDDKTFTAGVDNEVITKLLFNWWIVN